ncbi:hypothetical protein PR202_gb13930 [Eleusine coracana subsp. coracana]|uniref:Uncharacterized protein n=1 Tax=Eleusine coracana subsp. coracana TaxID=191504 RepID=A0AAV5EUB2_ELECO|nr:hypothetical protein PR202_gb13930 [Eleusine coracana subsp. coracana]
MPAASSRARLPRSSARTQTKQALRPVLLATAQPRAVKPKYPRAVKVKRPVDLLFLLHLHRLLPSPLLPFWKPPIYSAIPQPFLNQIAPPLISPSPRRAATPFPSPKASKPYARIP